MDNPRTYREPGDGRMYLAAGTVLDVAALLDGLGVPVNLPAHPEGSATATIANGTSLSGAANLSALGVAIAVATDAAWDTNAMTFQGSVDGTNFFDLRNMGVEVALTGVVASSIEPLNPQLFLPCKYLKVRSGTAAAPVNQVGATVVTVVARPVCG